MCHENGKTCATELPLCGSGNMPDANGDANVHVLEIHLQALPVARLSRAPTCGPCTRAVLSSRHAVRWVE